MLEEHKNKIMFNRIFLVSIITLLFAFSLYSQSGEWTYYSEENSVLPSDYVRAITQDLDSVIWIGTGGGVLRIKGNDFEVFTTENSGLLSNGIREIVVDSDNTKWFGTHGGLCSYNDSTWTSYTVSNSELHYNFILCLALDNEDNVWIGTANNPPAFTLGGVSRFNREDEWIHYNPDNSGLLSRNVRGIYPVDTGHVWFGCLGGLSIKNGENWTNYTSDDSPLPYDDVHDITRDENGWYWVGTYSGGGPTGGIVKYDGIDDWTIYDTNNSSLIANSVGTIEIDGCGNIWCGNAYLNRFDGENWNLFDMANSPIHDNSIAIIFEDISGNIWLGAIGNGVGVFKNDCYDSVSSNTSILSELDKISIFPNPFESEINLIFSTPSVGAYKFELYNINGRLVEIENDINFSNQKWKKNLSHLTSGIYFYQIFDEDKIVKSGKLIKN